MRLVEYKEELHRAIESLQHGNKSDADLWLSNFYYKRGRSRQNNYVKLLQWTLSDERYKNATPDIKKRIARFYYHLDITANNVANMVFVKRTANGYEILEQSSSK